MSLRLDQRPYLRLVLLLFGAGALLPILLLAWLGYRRDSANSRRAGLALLEVRADERVSSLLARVGDLRVDALQLAAAPDVQGLLAAAPEERGRLLPAVQQRLESYARTEPGVRGVGLLDAAGTVLAASEPGLVGRNEGRRAALQETLRGGEAVSDPYLAGPEAGGELSIAFASPVRLREGVGGVAVIWVRAQKLWELVARGDADCVLFDSLGIRVAGDSLFHPARPLPPQVAERLVQEQRFGEATRALLAAPVPFAGFGDDGRPAAEPFQLAPGPARGARLGVMRAVPGLRWTLAVFLPQESLEGPLRKLLQENALAAALALVFTLLAAGATVNSVVKPLRRLTAAARAMGEGDLSAHVELPPKGELGLLIESFNRMAEAVRRRTGELEERSRELAAARDAAMESSRLKTAFLANVSHELRTPLNGVIGMLELLVRTPLRSNQRSYAETARSSGQNLLGIINDLLDVSKIEAGRLDLDTAPFEIRRCIDQLLESFAERASRKNLELVALVQEDVPPIAIGDMPRLLQILNNLVGNALKFTDRGEIVVEVAVAEQRPSGALLRFTVSDTGIGIPLELQRHLFQPFSQVDSSSTRKYGGTGLGLAISRELAVKMGGQIGVESQPGQRTSFWFTAHLALPGPGSQALVEDELGGLRLLIADAGATSRLGLQRQAASFRMRDAQAASGPAALELLAAAEARQEPFALAVIDVRLPGEPDGLELVRRLRALPADRRPGVVVIAPFGDAALAALALEAGAEALVTRPVRHALLYEAFLKARGRQPLERATLAVAAPSPPSRLPANGRRVLVAEDNAVNQRVAQGVLENLGYAVDLAANGREALEALSALRYDAVLMDCQMPELDGYEATRLQREREAGGPRTPIIAMTANALEGEREKCLAAGMDDYLSKPVSVAELERVLLRAAGGEPGAEQPPREPDKSGEAVLDENVLQGLRDLQEGGGLVQELAELLAREGPLTLERMRAAAAAGDPAELGRAAHALKGGAGNLGARGLSQLCSQIEDSARAGETARAAALLPAAETELGRVLTALRAA